MEKQFRYAFVAHNSKHDFTELKELCEEIKFLSTGYEQSEDLSSIMEENMREFDASRDILVPVGNVASNVIMGAIAVRMHVEDLPSPVGRFVSRPLMANHKFWMAFYKDKQYQIKQVEIGA
jgi:hypothetical protein